MGLCDNQIKKKEKKKFKGPLSNFDIGVVIHITRNYKSLPSLDALLVIEADNP